MHNWGEEGFDWNSLNECINLIHDTCVRWGRLGGQAKEKFGEVRFYAQFGNLSLHGLLLPGWYNYGWMPQWLITFDNNVFTPVINKIPFLKDVFYWWQKKVYNYAYWKAMRTYPHLRPEILSGADEPEFIKGVSRREGKDLHLLDWDGTIIATWHSC